MVYLQEDVLNYISMLKAAIGVMERFFIESEVDMKIRQAKKIMKEGWRRCKTELETMASRQTRHQAKDRG